MMFTKQIILFASIFAIICASKEQSSEGGFVAAESNHIYSQPIQDNIAAESEVAKRGAAVATTSTATNNENQGQSSPVDVGTNSGSGSSGVISFNTPNSFQQFFSPTFGQFGQFGQFGGLYAAALLPQSSTNNPQIFYVRAPSQYVTPSGVGTIKLSYTSNSAQPQTTVQYASTTPKVAYAIAPNQQYQLAIAATQPNPYVYSPVGIASPYTTSAYTNPNSYSTATTNNAASAQLPAASLQQGQIIPYTASSNGIYLTSSQLQQLGYAIPQSVGAPATAQPYTYTTATPILPSVPKIGTTVVTPTAAAYYSAAPASQAYQQTPTFLSYQNAGLNYATAQKLVAYPTYTQATYRPIVPPTPATASSAYTNAYIQPTGGAPVKVRHNQQRITNNRTNSIHIICSHFQHSASQAIAAAAAAQAPNPNYQYATSQLYQPSLSAAKSYGYTQIPTAQKYFYASS
ncbi:uncharacterized protein LOC129568534 [Sitodiplosis mosellana]|uniref:uncharacterized protein LOC129568534 n=1 Tax=Sitodiplosis mosellana TaxID=263140 RepID=UPI0024449D0B|nr:uncharacterized protein LOC129568534 [Sitodiplosis mosellana]